MGIEWQISEINERGSCNLALPGKIDDFEASCEWQPCCHGSFDEVNPVGWLRRMNTNLPGK
jgi:hypothetical protein